MNGFVYVVSLVGKDVHHTWSTQCVLKYIADLDKVRTMLKEQHCLEFEELATQFYSGYLQFDNITDNRDIKLIVERVDVM